MGFYYQRLGIILIKTFSFDANENYTRKATGQGITTGDKLITMPRFIGKSVSEAEAWADENNIRLDVEFADSDSEYYNPDVLPGMIAGQSISDGMIINDTNELTVYINSGENTSEENDNNTDNQDVQNNEDNEEQDNNDSDNDGNLDDIEPGIYFNEEE